MSRRRAAGEKRSIAEWVTLAISAAIVGALALVALVAESQRARESRVNLEMTFDTASLWIEDGLYHVPFSVMNDSSEAIVAADIWFEISANGEMIDTDEITVQFLPLQGRQDGVYVTQYNPATHDLGGRLESVQFP